MGWQGQCRRTCARQGFMSARNLLTDIAGVSVGHADDAALASGVTAIIFDRPAVASIDVRGGGPGIREDALLAPHNVVEAIDAITLSGGSALGLDAAGGVQAWLAERGRGFRVRDAVIPIVPGAICFDLLNGGNKAWGRFPPYRDLGYAAAAAAGADIALGSAGAGLGPWFWAAPFEVGDEYGGRGLPPSFTRDMLKARLKGGPAATS